jgi:branched-chain amino acid transport system permease protein
VGADPGAAVDRAELVRERFRAGARERVAGLVSQELVAEHAARPLGPHSDDLARVLTFLRGGDVEGKHVVVTIEPDRVFRIGRIRRADPSRPVDLDDGEYPSIESAFHEIFVQRIAELDSQAAR